MLRRKDIGIDFSKKKITQNTLLKSLKKYIDSEHITFSDIKSLIYKENSLTAFVPMDMLFNLQC